MVGEVEPTELTVWALLWTGCVNLAGHLTFLGLVLACDSRDLPATELP